MAQHLLFKRLQRTLGRVIEQGLLNAGPVTIHYVDKAAPDVDFDPNVESSYPAAEEKTVRVSGLVHIVSARTVQRQFAEIKAGDAIVTFDEPMRNMDVPTDPDNLDANVVDLTAMDNIRFEINGDLYVQATVGKDLIRLWDIMIGGEPLANTIALRLAN